MYENLSEKEIEFMEYWYDPVANTECLIPVNLKAPQRWSEDKDFDCVRVRNYQFPMIDYSMMYADDSKLTPYQNFRIKKIVGTCYNIASRDIGKSFYIWIDAFIYLIHARGGESMLAAPTDEKLKKIADPLLNLCKEHPFFRIFKKKGKTDGIKSQPVEIATECGHTLYGRNEKINDPDPGTAFHSIHAQKLWYEEFCVDGRTPIHYVDNNGKRNVKPICQIVNSDIWKTIKVYSYNLKTKKIELKPITNIFNNKLINSNKYKLTIQDFGNLAHRYLTVSSNQKIYTSNGYKKASELEVGDTFYTQNYSKLTDIQKEIVVGTLLGDACITYKNRNSNLSLVFTHGQSQKEYLNYKKNCFLNLFKSFKRNIYNESVDFKPTSYGGKVGRLASDTCVDLNEFKNFKKPSLNINLIEKYISPISLAFWYMDDGMLIGNNGKTRKTKKLVFNSQGFSKDDQLLLTDVLRRKFSLEFKLEESKRFGKTYYRLYLDNENSLKCINLIKDYIHPTLYYKIFTTAELSEIIWQRKIPLFTSLSCHEDLLQEVKLLEISKEKFKVWQTYDFEVADNHNFFANGYLISNSYATKKGAEKRIDSESSLGCIDRFSGIPDLRPGSPLGDILRDKKKKSFVCRLPQYFRGDWNVNTRESKIYKYKGKFSTSYKLNVEGEILEGAFSKWDMQRIRQNCLKTDKHIKFFEINKQLFEDIEEFSDTVEKQKIIDERLSNNLLIIKQPSSKRIIASDIGTTGSPSEVAIFFGDDKGNFKYEYQISLFKLTTKEQAYVFDWLYRVLDGAFMILDHSNEDGRSISERLIKEYKIPSENVCDFKMQSNIKVGFKLDENGKVVQDERGKPIELEVYCKKWAVQQLENIFYESRIEIPMDEKFLDQFSNHFEKPGASGRPTWGSSTDEHLVDTFLLFALCVWDKCWRNTENLPKTKRIIGYI